MFTRLVVTRLAYKADKKNEVLFAEVTFFMSDGTKLMSMNYNGRLLPVDIKEGREVFLTMKRPEIIVEEGG